MIGNLVNWLNKHMNKFDYEELKLDCETNPTQFNLGYVQALYDRDIITREEYWELTDLIENSNDYREV